MHVLYRAGKTAKEVGFLGGPDRYTIRQVSQEGLEWSGGQE